MKRVILLAAASLVFVSCSSGSKKEEKASEAAVAPVAVVNQEAIQQKYSLQELNSVANAMKVIADDEKSQNLLGCEISSQKALSMMMPIKALIDEKTRAEVEGYEADPKGYSNTEGFESCAKNCSCGVYSDVVAAASERKMPAGSSVTHKRNAAKLRAKAERQTSEASLTCARKQSWFCSSDLRKFLDKSASEMP